MTGGTAKYADHAKGERAVRRDVLGAFEQEATERTEEDETSVSSCSYLTPFPFGDLAGSEGTPQSAGCCKRAAETGVRGDAIHRKAPEHRRSPQPGGSARCPDARASVLECGAAAPLCGAGDGMSATLLEETRFAAKRRSAGAVQNLAEARGALMHAPASWSAVLLHRCVARTMGRVLPCWRRRDPPKSAGAPAQSKTWRKREGP